MELGLKAGEVLFPQKIELIVKLFEEDLFLLDDSIKIKIPLVDYYQTEDKYYIVRNLSSVQNQKMERVEEGDIDVFTYFTSSSRPMRAGPNGTVMGGRVQTRTHFYFEKDGNLREMNLEDLEIVMKDDSEVLEQLKKIHTRSKRRAGVTALGGTMALVGLLLTVKKVGATPANEEFALKPNIFLVGGVITMIVPLLLGKPDEHGDMVEAIRTYNRNIANLRK
jgi:hypothetical protein